MMEHVGGSRQSPEPVYVGLRNAVVMGTGTKCRPRPVRMGREFTESCKREMRMHIARGKAPNMRMTCIDRYIREGIEQTISFPMTSRRGAFSHCGPDGPHLEAHQCIHSYIPHLPDVWRFTRMSMSGCTIPSIPTSPPVHGCRIEPSTSGRGRDSSCDGSDHGDGD